MNMGGIWQLAFGVTRRMQEPAVLERLTVEQLVQLDSCIPSGELSVSDSWLRTMSRDGASTSGTESMLMHPDCFFMLGIGVMGRSMLGVLVKMGG
jgi:hypothetical protein